MRDGKSGGKLPALVHTILSLHANLTSCQDSGGLSAELSRKHVTKLFATRCGACKPGRKPNLYEILFSQEIYNYCGPLSNRGGNNGVILGRLLRQAWLGYLKEASASRSPDTSVPFSQIMPRMPVHAFKIDDKIIYHLHLY